MDKPLSSDWVKSGKNTLEGGKIFTQGVNKMAT